MWAAFPQELEKRVEEKPILKKIVIRLLTLSLAIGLIFSTISFDFFLQILLKYKENMFIFFALLIVTTIFIGSFQLLPEDCALLQRIKIEFFHFYLILTI